MKKIVILDISSMLYTAYYAMPNIYTSTGKHSGALYGFFKKLKYLYEEYKVDHFIAAMDISRKNLKRIEIFSEYKSNRKPMPEDLKEEFNEIEKFLETLNIPVYKQDGEEADDIMGSLAEKLKKDKNNKIYIFTKDKDICQLLDDNVYILRGSKDITLIDNEEKVLETLGVYSNQIPDLFGIIGDTSDGIPGVPGIGDKTIAPIIKEYGSIENILENIDNLTFRNKKKLIENIEIAKLSRELATINRNIDLNISLLNFSCVNPSEFTKLCNLWELKTILKDYDKFMNFDTPKENNSNIEYEIVDDINKLEASTLYFYQNKSGYGISDGRLCYIETSQLDNLFSKEINKDLLHNIINKKLSNSEVIVYNIKQSMHNGYKINNYVDLSIIYHLVEVQKAKDLDEVISRYLGQEPFEISAIKLKKLSFVEKEKYEKQYIYDRLKNVQKIYNLVKKPYNEDEKAIKIYEELEKPLINVLFNMEVNGIKIDTKYMKETMQKFENIVEESKNKIYTLANDFNFNIDSPKQLGEILFEKLKLPIIKKNKNSYSTDNEVLEYLSKIGYEIANDILEYRKYTKLLTAYLIPLISKVDENDRLHTTFNQNGTSTGRLSSENPNLQVIPARTDEGIMIRKGLIASEGYTLLSCDYSQVELRLLAEMSKDSELVNAYTKELDLHEVTARTIFDKKEDEKIEREERNIAKIVNFSVLYGKTPFGLSKELDVSIDVASKYIKDYFNKYSGVKQYIESIVEDAKKNGYVETLLGTKRYIPTINSTNKVIFNQAKRMAVNTVIQGTASNIIKKVMIEISKILDEDVKMLLQVHDELIFEIKKDKIETVVSKIVDIMENTVKLKNVKLKVHYQYGDNLSLLK